MNTWWPEHRIWIDLFSQTISGNAVAGNVGKETTTAISTFAEGKGIFVLPFLPDLLPFSPCYHVIISERVECKSWKQLWRARDSKPHYPTLKTQCQNMRNIHRKIASVSIQALHTRPQCGHIRQLSLVKNRHPKMDLDASKMDVGTLKNRCGSLSLSTRIKCRGLSF